MVAPDPPAWLTVADYKAWARIADMTDDAAIAEAVAASMGALALRAVRAFPVDPDTGETPADPIPAALAAVHQAGLLLVNRLMSRRNSPDGVVGVPDTGTATIVSYDADISEPDRPVVGDGAGVSCLGRALEICGILEAAGVRATVDPGALAPPVALVIPIPRRTPDLACGYSATWTVHALAPAPTSGGDRTAASLLDGLADTICAALPSWELAEPGAYVLGPNTFPSYSITFTEGI